MLRTEIGLRNVADLLPGAIFVVDLDGQLIYANKKGRGLLGLAIDGKLVHLADKVAESTDTLKHYIGVCARNRQLMPGRLSIVRDDGTTLPCAVSGARVDASGRPGNRVLVLLYVVEQTGASQHRRFAVLNQSIDQLKQEVRARRRAEALLEAEKQALARVVHRAPLSEALDILARAVESHSEGMLVSILLLDADGRLRHAAAPSLPDDYIEAIDGVEIGPSVGSCGTAAYSKQTVIVSDIPNDPRWVEFRDTARQAGLQACWSTPVTASSGETLGTLALYYRSVREPTGDELQLIENSAHIAGLAIERHRSEEALQELLDREMQDRELAEAANRAKDEFLAMLSHELRNPLSAISNAANVLGVGGQTGEQCSAMQQIIVNETRLLKRILDDLLDISRLNNGKLRLRLEPIDLGEFMHGVQSVFEAAHPMHPIRVTVPVEPGQILADRSRLQQSLQNLLDNAVKHSRPGKEISLSMQGDESQISFVVKDSGDGIDPELLPIVFDPFVQSDNSLARTDSGLGLGLALVKRFVEMHGGTASAYSAGAGHGSEFILRLPRAAVGVEETPSATSLAPERGTRRVLVVEDNAGAREGLCRLLALWGHDVRSAADGSGALRLVQDDPPDIALVDIGLPDLDGYEVARAIRRNPSAADVTLIALTGYGHERDRRRATEAGFEHHIVKPAEMQDLIAVFGEPVTAA